MMIISLQGHSAVVYDVVKSSIDQAVAKGAVAASSPGDVASQVGKRIPHQSYVQTKLQRGADLTFRETVVVSLCKTE